RGAGEGRQAQDDPVHRPRGDEKTRGPGDGGIREGNRRRGDLREDQRHVAFQDTSVRRRSQRPSAGLFLRKRTEIGMSKLTGAYHRLLNVLLAVSVGALLLPVTLQMISRLTGLIPAWIWTEEMARFLFIWMVMLGAMIGVREGTHFEVDVWPEMKPRANAALGLVSMIFVLILALLFVYHRLN